MTISNNKDILGTSKPATALVEAIKNGCGRLYLDLYGSKKAIKDRLYEIDELKKRGLITSETKADITLGERAEIRLTQDAIRAQNNRENVANFAIEDAERFGFDEDKNPDLDEDFIFEFWCHAERFSSEDMQKLWARILYNAAASKAKYPMRFLNFLASLSKEEIEVILKVAPFIGRCDNDYFIFDEIGSWIGSKTHPNYNTKENLALIACNKKMCDLMFKKNIYILNDIGFLQQEGWQYNLHKKCGELNVRIEFKKLAILIKKIKKPEFPFKNIGSSISIGGGLRVTKMGYLVASLCDIDTKKQKEYVNLVNEIYTLIGLETEIQSL